VLAKEEANLTQYFNLYIGEIATTATGDGDATEDAATADRDVTGQEVEEPIPTIEARVPQDSSASLPST